MNPEDLPLRDLHLPAMTGWWPLAPGWWVLGSLLVFFLVFLIRLGVRQWRHNAARRWALQRLAVIVSEFEQGANAVTLGKELSELTRRTMLAYASRDAVAGLTGEEWLAWLDRGLDDRPFSSGSGRILESLPYLDPQKVDNDEEVRGLIDAVRTRLRKPLPEKPPAEVQI